MKCFFRPTSCLDLFKPKFYKTRSFVSKVCISWSTLAAYWIVWNKTCIAKGKETDSLQLLYILFALCMRKHSKFCSNLMTLKKSRGISAFYGNTPIFFCCGKTSFYLQSPITYAKSVRMLCFSKQNNLVECRVTDACLRGLLTFRHLASSI